MSRRKAKDKNGGTDSKPWLEWTASSVGLLITVTLLVLLGWNAVQQDIGPPAVVVDAVAIAPHQNGYTVEIKAGNLTNAAAADVEIEGVLRRGDVVVESARARLDYVPAQSTRRGGLFFTSDPRQYDLRLRALGYARP